MAWEFPVYGYKATPDDRSVSLALFAMPPDAVPVSPLVNSSRTDYLIYRPSTASYSICATSGNSRPVSADEVEPMLLAGFLAGLPGRANAVTFINRIVQMPEHLWPAIMAKVAQDKPRTIYDSITDLVSSINSAYRTLGHATQRQLEISRMASSLSRADGAERRKLITQYQDTKPQSWIDAALKQENRDEFRAGNRPVPSSSPKATPRHDEEQPDDDLPLVKRSTGDRPGTGRPALVSAPIRPGAEASLPPSRPTLASAESGGAPNPSQRPQVSGRPTFTGRRVEPAAVHPISSVIDPLADIDFSF